MTRIALAYCRICGRPLTDPVSVELSIGPICRITGKLESMNEKTGNMFANRSEFDYGHDVQSDCIWIIDKGGMRTVTNDIENVLKDIATNLGEDAFRTTKKIMYKDAFEIWDGIDAEFEFHSAPSGHREARIRKIEFFPLTEKDFDKAKEKLILSK